MQTFLPYTTYAESAACLDWRRLGKQRMECKQMLAALGWEIHEGELRQRSIGGWNQHPAVKMWRGYHGSLADYMTICIMEWKSRGYNNTMLMLSTDRVRTDPSHFTPPWLGDESFHASHRSNLLRKNPEFYGKYGWTEGPDLPYVWPEPGPGPTRSTEF